MLVKCHLRTLNQVVETHSCFEKYGRNKNTIMNKSELIKKYEEYLEAAEKFFQLQEEYENTNKQYIEFCEKEKNIREKLPAFFWIVVVVFTVIGMAKRLSLMRTW